MKQKRQQKYQNCRMYQKRQKIKNVSKSSEVFYAVQFLFAIQFLKKNEHARDEVVEVQTNIKKLSNHIQTSARAHYMHSRVLYLK
jgi:putative hemolysin